MSGPVIARFATVHGHDRVCDFLRTAYARDRLAHALLFAGPDGIGKRGVALALAAFLQCEERGDDACGACAACLQIRAGSHPDVQMITVASGKREIGIERIRELKHFAQLQPVRGNAKVVIVDNAQTLTVAAQNALLKTLEEPPGHSVVVLVADNPDALLPTVRSRCQPVRFAPLPNAIVVDILTRIHGVAPEVAAEVATLAEGSPGRALFLSQHLTPEEHAAMARELAGLGSARYVALMRLAHDLNHPETATASKLEVLLAHVRDEAMSAVGAGHLARGHAGEPRIPLRTSMRRADIVHEACTLLRRGNPNRQLLLEAVLLRVARA